MSTLPLQPLTGRPLSRIDGPLKVCGQARYAAEFNVPRMAHAVLVLSNIPRGHIHDIDMDEARKLPGVIAVITHVNAMRLPQGGKAGINPPAGRALSLLQDDEVRHNGQPVALVVAESLEQARQAAKLVRIFYTSSDADLVLQQAKAYKPDAVQREDADTHRGDIQAGARLAHRSINQIYTTPVEHHNPMEPHATLAVWQGPQLTLYDATQYVSGVKGAVAKTMGIAPELVRVINPFVGGGFGCKGSAWSHVVLAAMAAKQVGRPVRLVLERPQMFSIIGNRPPTKQAMHLAADQQGHLTLTQHDVTSETSVMEDWIEPSAICTRMLYACDNLSTSHRLVKLHIPTPTFTRAPGEATGTFALESGLDELAYALNMDPVELRLRNHADKDMQQNKPFSSKSLRDCYRAGAERFGWSRRDPVPGSMCDGVWQIGWGMATATYPTNRSEAQALARYLPDGSALVQSGSQDLGTGTYTIMTQVAADALGLPVHRVKFELGDSTLPKAPVSGGSQTAASVAPAVKQACEAARDKLIALSVSDVQSPLYKQPSSSVTVINGWLQLKSGNVLGEAIAALIARHGGQAIEASATTKPGSEKDQFSMHAFGAVFAEVRVDRDLGIVRVPRIVGAYGVGKLLNDKTGESQLRGGMVWGVGLALMEETWRDARNGRYINANLAEYHVPVNADIGELDVIVVPEDDPHVNALGAKGIGEIGITGVGGAIANAVYHATGKRVRDLPITLDKLI